MLAVEIEKPEDTPELGVAIHKSSHRNNASIISVLLTTAKTHNCPGEVVHRNVHASSNYAYAGLGQYLAWRCRKQLTGLARLVIDSRDMVRELRAIKVPSSAMLWKRCAKHDFLPGRGERLLRTMFGADTASVLYLQDREVAFGRSVRRASLVSGNIAKSCPWSMYRFELGWRRG